MKRRHRALLMPWAGGADVLAYTNKVLALGPIAYWPMAEASGVVAFDATPNARNGAYTGVTLGQPGIGDGRTSASFDGATSFNNVYGASLAAAFNNQTLTAALWLRQSDTASVVRRVLNVGADDNNRVLVQRTSAQQIQAYYIAGGTQKFTTTAYATTTWIHVAITATKPGDQVKVYVNGVQSGATQTALGIWAGALAATRCVIGANDTTPTNDWIGNAAHCALWDRVLTASETLSLATVP